MDESVFLVIKIGKDTFKLCSEECPVERMSTNEFYRVSLISTPIISS